MLLKNAVVKGVEQKNWKNIASQQYKIREVII